MGKRCLNAKPMDSSRHWAATLAQGCQAPESQQRCVPRGALNHLARQAEIDTIDVFDEVLDDRRNQPGTLQDSLILDKRC